MRGLVRPRRRRGRCIGRRDGASAAAQGRRCAAPRAGDVRADARLLAAADRRHDRHHRLPRRRFEVHGLQHAARPRVGAHGRAPERDEIRALKSETGGDIVTTGSIRLVRELIAAGLVDEYRLFTYPVVLGRGQRLFADATRSRACVWWRASPFAPASCFCATGQPDGPPPAGAWPVRSTTARQPKA
jgi:riboflavin biosynthesis pyrimidine reductase